MRTSKKRFTIEEALSALFKAYKIEKDNQDAVWEYVRSYTEAHGKPPYRQITNTRFSIRGIKPALGWYVTDPNRKFGNGLYIELDGYRRKTFKNNVVNAEMYRFDRRDGHIFAYIEEFPDDEPVPVPEVAESKASVPDETMAPAKLNVVARVMNGVFRAVSGLLWKS